MWRCPVCGQLFVSRPEDIDAELGEWLAEAYQVGEQRHVSDPSWPRQRRPPA